VQNLKCGVGLRGVTDGTGVLVCLAKTIVLLREAAGLWAVFLIVVFLNVFECLFARC
jgi:hypothetical protein